MKKGNIKLTEIIFQEGNTYVAYNPQLDLSSCGKTKAEAGKNLIEAVEAFIEEAVNMGTLEEILSEQGFIHKGKNGGVWSPPKIVSTESIEISLPSGA